jgi:hypothetical protein
VPLAALNALVALERNGSGYLLKLALDGKSWEMDQYGTISGEKR